MDMTSCQTGVLPSAQSPLTVLSPPLSHALPLPTVAAVLPTVTLVSRRWRILNLRRDIQQKVKLLILFHDSLQMCRRDSFG